VQIRQANVSNSQLSQNKVAANRASGMSQMNNNRLIQPAKGLKNNFNTALAVGSDSRNEDIMPA